MQNLSHPEQFIWGNTRRKTCDECKKNRDRRKQDLDFLDLGDFIENEKRNLTADTSTNGVADIAYHTHLLVHMNTDTQNITPKEAANLIITEIESRDDYSWKYV
ncbi:2185_t:CDS:2 [Racocetra persica]|uniref:2185_t:CDS:1 n=1 Tax=Racocetra persica TaxID=160502 RepID=A0ACA9L0D2_9GLOM|nr:2185_t:CDS:2 [Racocetra persica]